MTFRADSLRAAASRSVQAGAAIMQRRLLRRMRLWDPQALRASRLQAPADLIDNQPDQEKKQ